MVLQRFSGTLCVDELHLCLASDPLDDLPVGFALVGANEQHMRRFLHNLARWGLRSEVVVSDGSSLDPELLAEIWPSAQHQLCVFHLLREVLEKVLAAVRRPRRAKARPPQPAATGPPGAARTDGPGEGGVRLETLLLDRQAGGEAEPGGVA
jgi:hypothetical protein